MTRPFTSVRTITHPRCVAQWDSPSLIDGQRNFALLGAMDERFKSNVRPAGEDEPLEHRWRPIDLCRICLSHGVSPNDPGRTTSPPSTGGGRRSGDADRPKAATPKGTRPSGAARL